MSVQSVCLGWHWQPYLYSRTADDTDGAPVKPMPATLVDLALRAVVDAAPPGACATELLAPDAAIVVSRVDIRVGSARGGVARTGRQRHIVIAANVEPAHEG